METRDDVLRSALRLSQPDRVLVLEALTRSLVDDAVAPKWDDDLRDELERRAEAVERGEMSTENWRVVLDRLSRRAAS